MTVLTFALPPLEAGDRVERLSAYGRVRRGVVVEHYKSTLNGQREGIDLYAVQWEDDERVERGYLRTGLTRLA